MEPSASQEQRLAAVAAFARKRLSRGSNDAEKRGRFERRLWDEAASFGLAGLPIPAQWGGSGLDAVETMQLVESLGENCDDGGLVFSLCAHMFASAVPIWRSKSPHHQQRYLRALASGELICANAASEPEAGSDVYAMQTKAVRTSAGYVLDGSKVFVTNAPVADVFLIYATTSPSRGYLGISAFLVPRDTAGLRVVSGPLKHGLEGAPWGSLYLTECDVPESARVGAEGAGASLFRESMVWERGCLFAYYVGAMQRTLDRCVEHARTRRQFGEPLGKFQAVANRIVDMKLRLETSRLLLYRAGELHRDGKPCDEAIAMSKLWISEAAVQVGLDAVHIFGASGITQEMGIDELLRDAIPSRIFSGSSEVQRMIVARSLGLS